MKDKGGMGFHDLQKFNQALLARQAWRLLVRPDSLCARIMKAKYYPNGTLLDTSFPKWFHLAGVASSMVLSCLKKVSFGGLEMENK
jgi:hypothetical protein